MPDKHQHRRNVPLHRDLNGSFEQLTGALGLQPNQSIRARIGDEIDVVDGERLAYPADDREMHPSVDAADRRPEVCARHACTIPPKPRHGALACQFVAQLCLTLDA